MTSLTIGLPVYNGSKTLRRSVERLLAQTFSEFQLIISDNASTDGTAELCHEILKLDRRISYYRHAETVVWNENFRSVLLRAETPYFMWATHDDLWEPRFAEANIAMLEKSPNAVCSVPGIVYFEPGGAERAAQDTGPLIGTASERLRTFFLQIDSCGRFYGLYRTGALRDSFPADLRLFGTDWLVVALTLLQGDHVSVPDVLLRRGGKHFSAYHRVLGSFDNFAPRWYDRLMPLHRLSRELQRRLPPQVWRDIRRAIAYVNLRQSAQSLEYRVPGIRGVVQPLRSAAANALHRRWRPERSRG